MASFWTQVHVGFIIIFIFGKYIFSPFHIWITHTKIAAIFQYFDICLHRFHVLNPGTCVLCDIVVRPVNTMVLAGKSASFYCDVRGKLDGRFEIFQWRKVLVYTVFPLIVASGAQTNFWRGARIKNMQTANFSKYYGKKNQGKHNVKMWSNVI